MTTTEISKAWVDILYLQKYKITCHPILQLPLHLRTQPPSQSSRLLRIKWLICTMLVEPLPSPVQSHLVPQTLSGVTPKSFKYLTPVSVWKIMKKVQFLLFLSGVTFEVNNFSHSVASTLFETIHCLARRCLAYCHKAAASRGAAAKLPPHRGGSSMIIEWAATSCKHCLNRA